jgi:hypothetical protein
MTDSAVTSVPSAKRTTRPSPRAAMPVTSAAGEDLDVEALRLVRGPLGQLAAGQAVREARGSSRSGCSAGLPAGGGPLDEQGAQPSLAPYTDAPRPAGPPPTTTRS